MADHGQEILSHYTSDNPEPGPTLFTTSEGGGGEILQPIMGIYAGKVQ